MLQDLALLFILGFILEALCTNMVGFVLDAIPTTTFSLFIIFVAVVRWNLWGLILIPILPLATILGGHFHAIIGLRYVYDWKCYLSIVFGLTIIGLDIVFLKRKGKGKTITSLGGLLAILFMNYIFFNVFQIFFFRLFAQGNPFVIGESLYTIVIKHPIHGKDIISNYYMEYGMIYNLFGLAISIIGTIFLRSQKVLCNATNKLVVDKENAAMLKKDEEEFIVLNSFKMPAAVEETIPAIGSKKK